METLEKEKLTPNREALKKDYQELLKKHNIAEGLLMFFTPATSISKVDFIGFGHMHIRRGPSITNLLEAVKAIAIDMANINNAFTDNFRKHSQNEPEKKPEPEYRDVD